MTITDVQHDPIDALVPPRPRRLTLLAISISTLLAVGVASWLYGFGYVYPQPECCGLGGASTPMTLSPDGRAVQVSTQFYNSSGRDLRVDGATADLPGATVVELGWSDKEYPHTMPYEALRFPALVPAHQHRVISITFVPDDCGDQQSLPWGQVTLDLSVANTWLPSIDRSYDLPYRVIDPNQGGLVVLPPAGLDDLTSMTDPVEAACALRGTAAAG